MRNQLVNLDFYGIRSRGMVYGMDGGINGVMACISAWNHASKSELWSEEELLKDKLGYSGKSQLLRDESRSLIGGLWAE